MAPVPSIRAFITSPGLSVHVARGVQRGGDVASLGADQRAGGLQGQVGSLDLRDRCSGEGRRVVQRYLKVLAVVHGRGGDLAEVRGRGAQPNGVQRHAFAGSLHRALRLQ